MSVFGLIFREFLFETIVLGPCRGIVLVNYEIAGQFMAHMYAALVFGLVAAFPYVVWELWRFVAPALYESEKKRVVPAFLMSMVLFYLGVAVGYYLILPLCMRFFNSYVVASQVLNTFSLQSYVSLLLSTLLLTGLVFEFPVLMVILSAVGIVNKAMLRSKRRYAIVVVLVLSALITPADPLSLFVMALPLYALYELSILCCKE